MQVKDKAAGWMTVPHDGAGTLMLRTLADGRKVYYGKFSVDGRQVKRALGAGLTERQAKAALGKLAATHKPKARTVERRTIVDAAAAMINALEADGAKPSTVRGYRSLASGMQAFFGTTTVDRVGARDVERFADHLTERGLSTATRWQHLRLLDATLRHAERRGWVVDPPKIEKPKGRRGRGPVRFLQPREVERVLDAYPDDPVGRVMRTLTLTAAWTGLRRGELLGLRWGSVDFDAEQLHVDENFVLGGYGTPKSGQGRSVPLPERVARELRTLRVATPYAGDSDPVFTHPDGTGRPLDASYVSKAFAAALAAAGVAPHRFHDTRHTYAVRAAQAGIPLTDLQEYLGHADISTTGIYARYAPRDGEAARIQAAMLAGMSAESFVRVPGAAGGDVSRVVSLAAASGS